MTVSPKARALALLAAAGMLAALAEVGPAAGEKPTRTKAPTTAVAVSEQAKPRPQLPGGGRRVFKHRILVAYYGTAQTASMGVLGEASPDKITRRLRKAARPFAWGDKKVQIVYELIATIADAGPGPDRDYSHFIPTSYVQKYVRAAKRNDALLVLDLQPGRATFPSQARHFRWALKKPWVGLALDPEWRMGPHQVPAQTVGSVKAAEVNQVSAMVAKIRKRYDLPEKLFMVHQFRTDMVRNIHRVIDRPGLAMVQHVDGFGSRGQKLATYHAVAKPDQFHMGFKLFYDEDVHLFRPRHVAKIRPKVQFISYQ